jgi:hypothetical protein
MRSVVSIAAAAPAAAAAFVAAFLLQPSPAAAQRICGNTAVEVNFQVWRKHHAEKVGPAFWGNCARSNYGDEWGSWYVAQNKEFYCYNVRAWRRYYNDNHVRAVTCDRRESNSASFVCFYRAIPCRYQYQRRSDDD